MANNNLPRRRERNVTGNGTGVFKRGSGLGTGPTGTSGLGKQPSASRPEGRNNTFTTNQQINNMSSGQGVTRSGGRGRLFIVLIVIAVIVVLIFVMCGRGSRDDYSGQTGSYSNYSSGQSSSAGQSSNGQNSYSGSSDSYLNSFFGGNSSYSTGWTDSSAATASLNTAVASGSRAKRTNIIGGGQDIVTILVYMCGADLESKSGMASSDLQEMTQAGLSDNINLIVYTGGASKWQNSVISNRTNQIYQVKEGGVLPLNENAGNTAMTDPSTLSSFISWGAANFPANRYELIFWDHGSGSVSGYGYDEKFPGSGSMSLAGINKALKAGGVTFDFIGFDTCLLATMENALMLNSYADYLIASEETEPGIGWYYTNWLTKFSNNTSMPTIEIGKNIVDDFVSTCAQKCPGQKATLSVVDLAELSSTTTELFSAFSNSITDLIENNDYKQVSDARNQTREFGSSSKIDMVDLVDLAQRIDNDEGTEFAEAIKSAVKYNKTSSGITNAYGLSIYFPYKSTKYVDKVTNTYDEIGIDEGYTKCIKAFASLEVCGQAAYGGTSDPFSSFFGSSSGSYGSSGSYSSYSSSSSDMISSLIGSFLGGDYSSISGLSGNSSFLSGRSMSDEQIIQYVQNNSIDPSSLVFEEYTDGSYRMSLSEKDRSLIHSLELNMYYDDGEGYINLGLDNVYDVDEEGRLVADTGNLWISINGQPVSYFYMDTFDDGENYVITGRVPAILNGEDRIDLILVFDNNNPKGYIAGAYYVYDQADPVAAKNLSELNIGDTLDFICDYYDYSGNYIESYSIGNQITVSENMEISDTYIDEGNALIMYRFTDIYNQEYWTEPIRR